MGIEKAQAAARRDAERLARFCLHGARAEKAADEPVRLVCGDGRGLSLDAKLFAACLRSGLVEEAQGSLTTTAAGKAYLKRALAGREGVVADQPFQDQHRQVERRAVSVDGDEAMLAVNLSESPLAAMARLKGRGGKRFFEEDAIMAGERLRQDFTRAGMQPRVSSNWEAGVSSGSARSANGIADMTDAALAARERTQKALRHVGPELSGILIDVCCFLKGLEAVERERGWPARSAKLMLRTALAALSRHYGYRK